MDKKFSKKALLIIGYVNNKLLNTIKLDSEMLSMLTMNKQKITPANDEVFLSYKNVNLKIVQGAQYRKLVCNFFVSFFSYTQKLS